MLRVLLALLIFMFHSRIHFQCSYGVLNDFVDMGAIAMTGFMLLSGYVLYLTYHKKDLMQIQDLKVFYTKRLISIIPLYYSIALLSIACGLLTGKTTALTELALFPIETLGLQSVFASLFCYSHNGGTWFISCILICYALFPFVVTVVKQLSLKTQVKAMILMMLVLWYSPFVPHFFHITDIYSNPFFRAMEFSMGVILANMATEVKEIESIQMKIILTVSSVLMLLGVTIAVEVGVAKDFMLYNWVALPCFIAIIYALSHLNFERLQNSKVLSYLSSISFTFFLCQVLPLWAISRRVLTLMDCDDNYVKIGFSFIVCLTGAIVIHEMIEKPSTRYLKQKFIHK